MPIGTTTPASTERSAKALARAWRMIPMTTVGEADHHGERARRLDRRAVAEDKGRNDHLSARDAHDGRRCSDEQAEKNASREADGRRVGQETRGCEFDPGFGNHSHAEHDKKDEDEPPQYSP